MSPADTIALSVFIVGLVQTGLLTWYAWETRKLRLDAAHQNSLLKDQLELMSKQSGVLQNDFERKLARQDIEAQPFFYWRDYTSNKTDMRTFEFENLGAEILILEMKCNHPSFSIAPTHLIRPGAVYKMSFNFDVTAPINFGFKYLNRYKQIKTVVWKVEPALTIPYYDGRDYETISSTRPLLQRGQLLEYGLN